MSGAPEGTKSLAVTLYDRDAPTGLGWRHGWRRASRRPPRCSERAPAHPTAGSCRPAPCGPIRSWLAALWGPLRPEGDKPHRLIFTACVIETDKLDAPSDASAAQVDYTIHTNALGSAALTAKYG